MLLPQRLTEVTGPVLGSGRLAADDHDLTVQHEGEPIGQRIQVSGRVLDSDGRPIRTRWSRSGRRTRRADTCTTTTIGPRRWTRTSPALGAA